MYSWYTTRTIGGNGQSREDEGIVVWDQKGIVVVWPDGHRTRLPWEAIRQACQCAECHARHLLFGETPPTPSQNGGDTRRS